MQGITILIIVASVMMALIGLIICLPKNGSLDSIKDKTVGNGQFGVARFATPKDIKDTFVHVEFDVEAWRNGENLPTAQGLIVGCKYKRNKVTALV